MTAPLHGLRVIEAARFITGPYATMLLADYGAEVIKVEQPRGGDPFRAWSHEGPSPRFIAHNRGKKSVALELNSPAGLDAFMRLMDTADVFVENFRPGVTARLGIDYAALSARNPRLIYCSISGFGEDGPYASRAAYDAVGQAMSGLMSMVTDMRDPRPVGPAFSDAITGFFAAYAVLVALQGRAQSGRGQHVTSSMLQATLSFLVEPATYYFQTGEVPELYTRARQSQSFSFACADGRSLVVHLSTLEKFWRALIQAVGRPELADDPRFAQYGLRVQNYEALSAELAPAFRTDTRDGWLRRLAEADLACAPVYALDEVMRDPQVEHLGMAVNVASEGAKPVYTVERPARLEDMPPLGPVPSLGEHTEEVLRGLGLTDEELAALGIAAPSSGRG